MEVSASVRRVGTVLVALALALAVACEEPPPTRTPASPEAPGAAPRPTDASLGIAYLDSGRIRRQPVTTGLRAGADVEILSGLDGDETVVLVRADSLEEDRPVEVIPAQKQQ